MRNRNNEEDEMIGQRILASLDHVRNHLFGLGYSETKSEGIFIRTYHADSTKRFGIVGTDGTIHTVASYGSMRHYYDARGRLTERIPVHKDLKEGERLATGRELAYEQQRLRKYVKYPGKGMEL